MPRTVRSLGSSLALPPGADLAEAFGRIAPLEIDLGCGDGSFLTEMARLHPERNFLGIERLLRRSGGACRRAERSGLTNVRIVKGEIEDSLSEVVAPGSVDVCHILFPDPWPKRRHHLRRLIHADFLKRLALALTETGEIRFRTDHLDYFRHAERTAESCGWRFAEWTPDENYPASTFEKRFRALNLPVYSAILTKR